jgi:hypothetical protein
MAHYYLYLLDAAGHIKAREILTASDDGEAVNKAKAYLREHTSVPGVEVWLGDRRIEALQQHAAA